MAIDTDLAWRTATVALLEQLSDVSSATDVGAPGSPVRHDVEIVSAKHGHVAIEATRVLDPDAQRVYREFDKRGTRWPWDGRSSWTVYTSDVDVHVKTLRSALPQVLEEFERLGITSANGATWVVEPRGVIEDFVQVRELFEALERWRIRAVERRDPDDRAPDVRVLPPVLAGWAWSPQQVVDLIQAEAGRKADQLQAAATDEGWLLLWMDVTQLNATMALRAPDWPDDPPRPHLPEGVDAVIAVVPHFGDDPHFILRRFHRATGWSSTRVEQGPVTRAVAALDESEQQHGPEKGDRAG